MNNKGITLIALVVTIVIMLILASITISSISSNDGIIGRKKEIANQYENKKNEVEATTGKIKDQWGNIIGDTGIDQSISTSQDGSWNQNKKVNSPLMKIGMTPIKFTEPTDTTIGTAIETISKDNEWYDYTSKKWANSRTQDGSMWVWIPRYAYKITYYTDANKTTESQAKTSYGSTEIKFLIGTTDNYYDDNGNLQTAKRCTSINETVDTTTGYTVHPAFTNESRISYQNGGWDSELPGFWVAKFEAGYASGNNTATVKASSVNYTQSNAWVPAIENGISTDGYYLARNWLDKTYGSTTTAIKYPTFQGLTYSMNYINPNDAFNIAKKLNESGNIYGLSSDSDSHMMKNSEWGAIAYLAQSQYGLNGTNIYINNVNLNNSTTSVYAVTGCSATTDDADSISTTIATVNSTKLNNNTDENFYVWCQKLGQKASSSGTIYGIYDLSGGTWERTAAYANNGNEYLTTYGTSLVEKAGISTKYTTEYPSNDLGESDVDTASRKNYDVNTKIYGDAVRETSTAGIESTSWYGDYSYFPALYNAFFLRSGNLSNESTAGLFYFGRTNGGSSYNVGFRAVLT